MPVERYYFEHFSKENEEIELKEGEFHHLVHVIRSRKGDRVQMVNGKGALATALLVEIKKDRALLTIETIQWKTAKIPSLILAQALPKQNRLDAILEKGTDLGVDQFWLFPGDLSAKKELFPNQLERARFVAIAAMKQCGRLFFLKFSFIPRNKKLGTIYLQCLFWRFNTRGSPPSKGFNQITRCSPAIYNRS